MMLLTWLWLLQGRAIWCKAASFLSVWGKWSPSLKGKYKVLVCVSVLFSSELCTAAGQHDAEQKQTWTTLDVIVAQDWHVIEGAQEVPVGTAVGRKYTYCLRILQVLLSLMHEKMQLWLLARLDQEYTKTSVQFHRGCSGSTCLCLRQELIQNSYWNPCQHLLAAAWTEVQRKKQSCYKSSFFALLITGSRAGSPWQSHKVLNALLYCCQGASWWFHPTILRVNIPVPLLYRSMSPMSLKGLKK